MPVTRTITVKSSGGDYASLSAALSGESKDLVSLDRLLVIECYPLNDTVSVDIIGWTTDATRYVTIRSPVSNRHSGIWDGSKYNLTVNYSGSNGGILRNRALFTRLEYLQIRNTNGSPAAFQSCVYDDSNTGLTVDGCICWGGWSGIDCNISASVTSTVKNTLCYGGERGCNGSNGGGGRIDWLNCTLIGTVYGLSNNASGVYALAKNVYAHGGTKGFASVGGGSGGILTKTNCASSDTTATDNTGGGGATACINNVAHSTANFASVSSGSEDYRLSSGSALIGAGADLSGSYTNDFNGDIRSVPFDVGCDEYSAGGVTPTPTPTTKIFVF